MEEPAEKACGTIRMAPDMKGTLWTETNVAEVFWFVQTGPDWKAVLKKMRMLAPGRMKVNNLAQPGMESLRLGFFYGS